MLENSERSVRGVRMGKSGPLERAELANQFKDLGFRTAEMLQKKIKTNILDISHLESRFLFSFV